MDARMSAEPASTTLVDKESTCSGENAEPLLFRRREYIDTAEASTTACVSATTSPVKEYTPDD